MRKYIPVFILFLVLFSLLSVQSLALADSKFNKPEIRKSLQVAHKFFKRINKNLVEGDYKCFRKKIQIKFQSDKKIIREVDILNGGYAKVGGCEKKKTKIHLRKAYKDKRQYDKVSVCQLIIHEFGHLIGFRHSPRKKSVMWSQDYNNEKNINGYNKIPKKAKETKARKMCDNGLQRGQ